MNQPKETTAARLGAAGEMNKETIHQQTVLLPYSHKQHDLHQECLQDTEQKCTFTKIPNWIFDELLPQLRSKAEFIILMLLCRKTLGWHKQEDDISIRQIAKATGLSKPTVIKGINSLASQGFIIKTKNISGSGDSTSSTYRILHPPLSGKVNLLPSKDILSCDKRPLPRRAKAALPTKETLPKENKNISSNPPVHRVDQKSFGAVVKMAESEYHALCDKLGKQMIDEIIEEMNDWCQANGRLYKNYAAAVRQWARKRKKGVTNVKVATDPMARHKGLSKDDSPVTSSRIHDFSKG